MNNILEIDIILLKIYDYLDTKDKINLHYCNKNIHNILTSSHRLISYEKIIKNLDIFYAFEIDDIKDKERVLCEILNKSMNNFCYPDFNDSLDSLYDIERILKIYQTNKICNIVCEIFFNYLSINLITRSMIKKITKHYKGDISTIELNIFIDDIYDATYSVNLFSIIEYDKLNISKEYISIEVLNKIKILKKIYKLILSNL